jgi:hypothetical protein
MIEDMTVRNFIEKTRNDYIRQVKIFTSFLGRSPDTATAEDLAKPRGGGAVAGGGTRTEVQGGTERRLRCGSAGLRWR